MQAITYGLSNIITLTKLTGGINNEGPRWKSTQHLTVYLQFLCKGRKELLSNRKNKNRAKVMLLEPKSCSSFYSERRKWWFSCCYLAVYCASQNAGCIAFITSHLVFKCLALCTPSQTYNKISSLAESLYLFSLSYSLASNKKNNANLNEVHALVSIHIKLQGEEWERQWLQEWASCLTWITSAYGTRDARRKKDKSFWRPRILVGKMTCHVWPSPQALSSDRVFEKSG